MSKESEKFSCQYTDPKQRETAEKAFEAGRKFERTYCSRELEVLLERCKKLGVPTDLDPPNNRLSNIVTRLWSEKSEPRFTEPSLYKCAELIKHIREHEDTAEDYLRNEKSKGNLYMYRIERNETGLDVWLKLTPSISEEIYHKHID